MGLFSSDSTALNTWHAHVRIEKKGQAAEYNDTVSARPHVTAKGIEKEVIAAIVNHSPHLKGGRVTRRTIRRVR
ncbi:MAG: hypothetical protein HOY69_22240 [Streptomyces sp.]|nr:hypothetical protein [Streptomyces sp.]